MPEPDLTPSQPVDTTRSISRSSQARNERRRNSSWISRLLALFSGIYLVLAAPVSVPGGFVERVQANLVGLNFGVLLTRELPALVIVLILGGLIGWLIYALTALLVVHPPKAAQALPLQYWDWLKYALPMLLVWGLYLMAFYPAMMSGDSFNQWGQARTGQYETGHPLLHTLFLWFWMQIWDSPALVAMVQILALALLTAWGVGQLRRRGLPEWAAWGVAALFALSPVNGTMTISIWKDIPYSIAVFALSLLILLISLDASWLARHARSLWLVLGLVCVGVGLFRLNGILIVPLVLPLLALVYRRSWKVFAGALALFVVVWAVVQWPLPALLKVQEKSVITGTIALHHIAAHLYSGTQPTPAEQAVLEKVMPLDKWGYYCYSINPLQSNPALNKSATIAATGDLYRVALAFFLRHPTVDVEHTLCAGSLVYRVGQTEEAYLLAMQVVDTDYGIRYLPKNDLGFEETPILPGLTARLIPFLRWTNLRGINAFFWRPAVPLYLLIWVGVVLVLRNRRRAQPWRLALFLLPALIQSAGLFLTNISQSFRYQYAVYLIALFALALLFLPTVTSQE